MGKVAPSCDTQVKHFLADNCSLFEDTVTFCSCHWPLEPADSTCQRCEVAGEDFDISMELQEYEGAPASRIKADVYISPQGSSPEVREITASGGTRETGMAPVDQVDKTISLSSPLVCALPTYFDAAQKQNPSGYPVSRAN